jgi:F-type H+-transporting ATPase subunit gamma
VAALKEVRQRIRAVRGIGQVTKAMKLVASVKLRRVQDRVVQTRPYVDALYEMAGRLTAAARSAGGEGPVHPLLVEGPPGAEALVIVGSDRGLCGAFNVALFRHVLTDLSGARPALILIGRKAKDFWGRRGYDIVKTWEKIGFPAEWDEAERIAREVVTLHTFFQFSRVRIAYQSFVSPGVCRPVIAPWLPFEAKGTVDPWLRCEPSLEAVLDLVLPRALTAQLHQALLEAQASEQGARMVAMDSATENASELAGDLQLLANKLRQTGITKELLEITAGVESMKGVI